METFSRLIGAAGCAGASAPRNDAVSAGGGFQRGFWARPRSLREPDAGLPAPSEPDPPDLLGLLEGPPRAAFTAPVGVDERGQIAWLDLRCEGSRHVLVEGGPQALRSEIVRTLAVGFALTSRPALLQLLAVDFSGRELPVLESLPHAVVDLAIEPAALLQSMAWLSAELEMRQREGRRWPEMLLVIDDLLALEAPSCARARGRLVDLLRGGSAWGIHVLAGAGHLGNGLRAAGWSRADVARVVLGDSSGMIVLRLDGSACRLVAGRLSAADLDRVSQGLRGRAKASLREGAGRSFPRRSPKAERGTAK